MRGRRFVVVAAAAVALTGCAGHTGGRAVSPSASGNGASSRAAGQPISPDQQLESSTQLQADLDALTGAPTVGDLQTAVTRLQQDYNAVASSAVSSDGADWQHAINSLQQTLADVSQLANANSSTPDAPNPLHSNASRDHTSPGAKSPAPAKPAPPSPSQIISEVKDVFGMLGTVIKHLAFTIIVNNAGPGTVTGNASHPRIYCGPSKTQCKGYVLATSTAALAFQDLNGGGFWIDKVDSKPEWSCNANYNTGKSPAPSASCNISATSGNTVTVTPHWVPQPTPPRPR